jgi:leader peptidase (prepilin peptidase)/N-methyltransferase
MSGFLLLGGASLGIAASLALAPLTSRALAGSVARAQVASTGNAAALAEPVTAPRATAWQRAALALASGLVLASILLRVGPSVRALPVVVLLVGLVQLAYCDVVRHLLPKTLVYALTGAVLASGAVAAGSFDEWRRFAMALAFGVVFYAVFFLINLLNPRWMAYGDVRLSFVVGFGLAWIRPGALVDAFFISNLLAAVAGLCLIAARKANRNSAMPFGLYLALGTAITALILS